MGEVIEVDGDTNGRAFIVLLYRSMEWMIKRAFAGRRLDVRVPAAKARRPPSFDAGLRRAWPRYVSLPLLQTLPHHTPSQPPITSHPQTPQPTQ